MLPLIASSHQGLISRPLPTLPVAAASLPDDASAAEGTALGAEVLLARAPAADHTVGPLVGVVLRRIVALVARMHLAAARESEPAVAALVVFAGAAPGERIAYVQAQLLLASARTARRREDGGARGIGEKLDVGDLERETAVALAAHVRGRLAAHRH